MISILMTIYNEPFEWVQQAINSIANQTVNLQIEIVLVVDNPNYADLEELEKLVKLRFKNRTIIINEVNQGLVNSLNIAFQNSSGKYIARMDADDVSFSDRFEVELNFLKEYDLDFVASSILLIDENGLEIKDLSFSGNLLNKSLIKLQKRQNQFWHPTWFMKRDVMANLSGYRKFANVEDYDFVLRAILKQFKLGLIGNSTVKKRFNKASISETNNYSQTVYTAYLAKNFRNDHVANLAQLPLINLKREADYYQIKEIFGNRNSISISEKVKLMYQLIFHTEGRRILKTVILQKYQVKILVKMKVLKKVFR